VKALVFIAFCVLSIDCFGQVKEIYYQEHSILFTNTFIFTKQHKDDTAGTFIQNVWSDDGQSWYGHGSFSKRKKNLILNYESLKDTFKLELDSGKKTDTIYIKWNSLSGTVGDMYLVYPSGDKQYAGYLDLDSNTSVSKISKKAIAKDQFYLCSFKKKIFIDLKGDKPDSIKIFSLNNGEHIKPVKTVLYNIHKNYILGPGEFINAENARYYKTVKY
jgi:hypothetical protein